MIGQIPEPWIWSDDGKGNAHGRESLGEVLRATPESDISVSDEDAALIAAAPDLLEALEECLPCLGWHNMSDEDIQLEHELGNGYAELILRARSAIAKAKGEK